MCVSLRDLRTEDPLKESLLPLDLLLDIIPRAVDCRDFIWMICSNRKRFREHLLAKRLEKASAVQYGITCNCATSVLLSTSDPIPETAEFVFIRSGLSQSSDIPTGTPNEFICHENEYHW